jgi:hypothetical protein
VIKIYLSIAQQIATAILQNKSDPDKVTEWVGYMNLATALAGGYQAGSEDLATLDDQIREAASEGRGLTPEQRAAWRARDDIATDVARKWLADHPDA